MKRLANSKEEVDGTQTKKLFTTLMFTAPLTADEIIRKVNVVCKINV